MENAHINVEYFEKKNILNLIDVCLSFFFRKFWAYKLNF